MKNHKRYLEPAIHMLIWLSAYIVLITFIKTVGPFKKIDGTLLLPATFGTFFNAVLFYVTSLLLIPMLSARKKAWEFILLTFLLLFSLTIAETLIDSAFFRYYYSSGEESLFSQIIINLILNIVILSLALGYGFSRNWLRSEKMKQQLEHEKLVAELNFMRSQLNPHFLFNVLNMAYSSASRYGDDKTADIIEKLSGMMRYMLYESNVERISVEKEIDYINSYIDLQKKRFSDEIKADVNFRINGNYTGCSVAPLILIQLVENAFKYGVKLGNDSYIDIMLEISDQKLIFSITNPVFTGSDYNPDRKTGIGLDSVRKRLGMMYPGQHYFYIKRTDKIFEVNLEINLN
jgi:sensor histidine kinase YesM